MKIRYLGALLLATSAHAQAPGTVNLIGRETPTGAPTITSVSQVNSAINTALSAKVDVSGGNASVVNVTANGSALTLAQWMSYLNGTANPNAVVLGKTLAIQGSSPTTSGSAVLSITNTTPPVTTNELAYQISDRGDYDIPAFGGTVRPRIFQTNLSVPTGITSTTIHENFWSSNYMTGGGTSGVEINQFHAYFQNDMTGSITGPVEGYEASALNNGVMNAYDNYLAIFNNTASATTSNIHGFKAQLTNSNAAAGSVGAFAGLDCEAMAGAGSHPTFEYCIRNGNPQGAISTLGYVNIGSLAVSPIPLQIIGSNLSGATPSIKIVDSAAARLFEVDNDGTLHGKGNAFAVNGAGQLQLVGPDQSVSTVLMKAQDSAANRLFEIDGDGTLRTKGNGFTVNGSGQLLLNGPDQLVSTVVMKASDSTAARLFEIDDDGTLRGKGTGFLVNGSGQLFLTGIDQSGATTLFKATDSTAATLFEIHDNGALVTTGVTAVSCTAASVTLASLVVTNGLVTHC
jgi:hypothetical protein